MKKTKSYFTKVNLLAFILGASFLLPHVASGKSVQWSENSPGLIASTKWNDGICVRNCANMDPDRWILRDGMYGAYGSLQRAQAVIERASSVFNNTTGAVVDDSLGRAAVSVGDSLSFRPRADLNTDISWSGTGHSADTPNGRWSNGGPSSCSAADYLSIENFGNGVTQEVYGALHVKSTAPTIVHAGSAGLSCDGGGFNCTVISAGTIDSRITYPSTQGHYYLSVFKRGQLDPDDDWVQQGCNASGRPMHDAAVQAASCTYFSLPSVSGSDNICMTDPRYEYTMNVPDLHLDHELLAINNNNIPNPPSLSGPTTGSTNTNYPFTTQASDPDGDTVRYGIDWDNNNTVDEWTASVASNTAVNTNRQWATPGTYTLKALTQDSKNAVSGWSTPLTITIQTIVNGTCGAASGFPTTNPPTVGLCFSGTNTPVTPGVAPGPYSWTCLGSGGGTNSPVCTAPYLEPAPVVDLKINGSDTPITIARNGNLNITWGNIPYAVSCTGTGNNWTGGKFTTGGNDNIQATAASLYTLTCTNSQGISASDSISVTLQPTLKICQNSCSSNIEPPSAFSMNVGDTKNLYACYNDAVSCTDSTGDVTTSATWTEGGNSTVNLSGSIPKVLTASSSGTESIQATYSGNTTTKNITVTCTDSSACSRDPRSQSLCQKDTFTVTDNCGATQTCNGGKTCDYNWKEVAP